MQGIPVELHVTILFATLTADIPLHIPGWHTNSFTANANNGSPVVMYIMPIVFAEIKTGQMCFASYACKGVFGTGNARESLRHASFCILQILSVKGFVTACVPAVALALV